MVSRSPLPHALRLFKPIILAASLYRTHKKQNPAYVQCAAVFYMIPEATHTGLLSTETERFSSKTGNLIRQHNHLFCYDTPHNSSPKNVNRGAKILHRIFEAVSCGTVLADASLCEHLGWSSSFTACYTLVQKCSRMTQRQTVCAFSRANRHPGSVRQTRI